MNLGRGAHDLDGRSGGIQVEDVGMADQHSERAPKVVAIPVILVPIRDRLAYVPIALREVAQVPALHQAFDPHLAPLGPPPAAGPQLLASLKFGPVGIHPHEPSQSLLPLRLLLGILGRPAADALEGDQACLPVRKGY